MIFPRFSGTDKPVYNCGLSHTANKILNNKSTLTPDQQKIDISYYKLDLEILIDERIIGGTLVVRGHFRTDQPDLIELDLSSAMSVDSVKFFGEVWPFEHDNHILKIPTLQITMHGGYDFSVEIFYGGTPIPSGFGSFNFDTYNGEDHVWTLSEPYGARDWWPCKDDPSDKADSMDIIISLPDDQIPVSNGLLINEVEIGDGKKKYHWKEKYPISTYLVSITTYPYRFWSDNYISPQNDTMPIDFYVYPNHYDMTYNNYLKTKEMITIFSEKFGEYPFINEKYGHVEFNRAGGMEHQTISSMGGHSEWLIAHELAHQWWGNLVTCASFNHIWLNEGFARFGEALWQEEKYGVGAYRDFWSAHAYYGPGTVYVENPTSTSEIFNGNLSYNKAGWVLHMLRGILGDSIFFDVLKSYATNDSLAYNAVTTEKFQNVSEYISGLELDYFFDQWIYGEGYPKYSIDWEINKNSELIVNIQQVQKTQYFKMPINLQLLLPDGITEIRIDNSQAFETYNLGIIGSSTFNLILDPDEWILKEVQYLNMGYEFPGPSQITLYPAYPNPFNSGTTISFFIPETVGEKNGDIKIYDLKGKYSGSIWSGKTKIGLNKINWKAYDRPSGIYFIVLDTENKNFSQKVQFIK
tara:strand:- start:10420 stop:12330 length:1911 start_codon:yes stop_codon:yes gene_type:complete